MEEASTRSYYTCRKCGGRYSTYVGILHSDPYYCQKCEKEIYRKKSEEAAKRYDELLRNRNNGQ